MEQVVPQAQVVVALVELVQREEDDGGVLDQEGRHGQRQVLPQQQPHAQQRRVDAQRHQQAPARLQVLGTGRGRVTRQQGRGMGSARPAGAGTSGGTGDRQGESYKAAGEGTTITSFKAFFVGLYKNDYISRLV